MQTSGRFECKNPYCRALKLQFGEMFIQNIEIAAFVQIAASHTYLSSNANHLPKDSRLGQSPSRFQAASNQRNPFLHIAPFSTYRHKNRCLLEALSYTHMFVLR